VTFETNDNYSIRFEISNNSSTIRFDSIRNEKNTIRTSLPETPSNESGVVVNGDLASFARYIFRSFTFKATIIILYYVAP